MGMIVLAAIIAPHGMAAEGAGTSKGLETRLAVALKQLKAQEKAIASLQQRNADILRNTSSVDEARNLGFLDGRASSAYKTAVDVLATVAASLDAARKSQGMPAKFYAQQEERIVFAESTIKATQGFIRDWTIHVYKGMLPPGTPIPVKVTGKDQYEVMFSVNYEKTIVVAQGQKLSVKNGEVQIAGKKYTAMIVDGRDVELTPRGEVYSKLALVVFPK